MGVLRSVPAAVVLAAVIVRTAWRCEYRSYRYVYWDTDHAGENIYLTAESLGLATVAVGAFYESMLVGSWELIVGGEVPHARVPAREESVEVITLAQPHYQWVSRVLPMLGFPRRVVYSEPAPGAVAELLELVGASRVLVVSDPVISRQGFFQSLLETLRDRFEVTVYDSVSPEPPVDVAEEIARAAEGTDAIIAVGGGSVIDAAKAGMVLAERPGLSIEDVAPFSVLGIELEKPVLIAVPTTAGTGSDASYGIVLTRGEGSEREKIAVGSYEVIPLATVLDPSLPLSAPARVRIGAIMDALSHAIEALASTASNPFSEALAEHAARTIFEHAKSALEGDSEAMARIHAAATMAGMAFTNSGLGLAHALAHPLGALLSTHHGTTVGIVLLGVLPIYEKAEETGGRLDRLLRVLQVLGLTRAESLRDAVAQLYDSIGAPTRFRDLGVDAERYREAARLAAERALHEPNIAFSPIVPSVEEMVELLLSLY